MPRKVQVVLASRPGGAVTVENFRVVEAETDPPREGEILVRNDWLSIDPYMRRRIDASPGYAPPVEIGAVMIGGTVGVVVASRNVDWPEGTAVVGNLGWQSHAISDGRGLRRLDPRVPPQAHLGVCGMPGVTAHLGLLEFGRPRAGETVVVSAAAGAVGSIVGQIAKLHGARAVGIAGGPAKIRHVVEELGFDACVDHRAPDFEEALARATPDGIDVNFENVGGRVMAAVLSRMNPFSRMPLCGLVSEYDGSSPSASSFAPILAKRIAVRGFIVSDHLDHWPAALDALATWVAAGTLRHHETVFEGLPRAPEALIAMLRGENVGKMLVRISSPSA